MTVTLTDFDRTLFRLLQADGRLPYVALAEQVGSTESRVRRRVERLIANDTFSVTAVANPRLLGLDFVAWVGLVTAPGAARAVAAALISMPTVKYGAETSGRLPIIAEIACRSGWELLGVLDSVRALPGVVAVESALYLTVFHQRFQWLVPTEADARSTGVTGAEADSIDEADLAVIRELRRDGRATFREVAERLDLSERSVAKRYRNLVTRHIVQVTAVGDPLRLGFAGMAWLSFRLVPGCSAMDVAEALVGLPPIDYVVMPTGEWAVMAELVCADSDELRSTLDGPIAAIDGIAYIEAFPYVCMLYRDTRSAWGAGLDGDKR